jgi:hypothetical protein
VVKLPVPAQSRTSTAVPLAVAPPAVAPPAVRPEIVAVHVRRIVAALVVGGIAATRSATMTESRRTRDRSPVNVLPFRCGQLDQGRVIRRGPNVTHPPGQEQAEAHAGDALIEAVAQVARAREAVRMPDAGRVPCSSDM